MPAILDRLVSQLKAKGMLKKLPLPLRLQKSGNLKKGTSKATPKGKRRGKMSPAQRAIDRASKKIR